MMPNEHVSVNTQSFNTQKPDVTYFVTLRQVLIGYEVGLSLGKWHVITYKLTKEITGTRLNIKMPSYQSNIYYYKDQTSSPPSYLYDIHWFY